MICNAADSEVGIGGLLIHLEEIAMTGLFRRLIPGWQLVVCTGMLAVSGCGGGDSPPPLAVVKGTVTLDGNPLPNAAVLFTPTNGKGGASSGTTDSSGAYSLNYPPDHAGAVISEHVVRITGKTGGAATAVEPVPPKYNDKSELKATVKAGENKHDFALLSK